MVTALHLKQRLKKKKKAEMSWKYSEISWNT